MLIRTVRLSSKGQLSLPVETLRALKLAQGAEFVLIQDRDRLVLIPSEKVAQQLMDDTKEFPSLGLSAFKDVWDNPDDEIWNEA